MNKNIFIKYLTNQPVKIETHFVGQVERKRPLKDVSDLVAAYFPNTPPNELAQYTLHLPEGLDRSASGLAEECFSLTDSTGTTLRSGLLLERLNGHGIDDFYPLIIKSKNDSVQGLHNSLTEAANAGENSVVRTEFTLGVVHTNEGVPGPFRTDRLEILERFYRLIYPVDGPHRNILFIKAPPYSGKTGFAQLFCQRLRENADRSVVFLSCQQFRIGEEDISTFFYRTVNCSLDSFVGRSEERVLIVDEAQCSYSDEYFWKTIVKLALNASQFPGLRIVLLSSFGSFNPHRLSIRDGTPIEIPPENTFGLYDTFSSPGLNLHFAEFLEMAAGSVCAPFLDIVWLFCSNHIGVASSILKYLNETLRCIGDTAITLDHVQPVLYSKGLLRMMSANRGMPTHSSFSMLVDANNLYSDEVAKLKNVLQRVAKGEVLYLDDEATSPGSSSAILLLVKAGFLFEDENRILRFASQMHLKVWLNSTREDCAGWMQNISVYDFIVLAIGRMHSARLAMFHHQNLGDVVRERQVQMELYSAIVSLCPKDIYVTPEWRTADKKGYVDIVLQFQDERNEKIMWFLELLVDGVGAKEHLERFSTGGKYRSSLIPNSQYALLDFRQNVAARKFKEDFVYVSFSDSFKMASLKCDGKSESVSLLLD